MEKLRQLLGCTLSEKLEQIVISAPRTKALPGDGMESDKALSADKIKIRPVLLADGLVFQQSAFVNTQVFHKNFEKAEMMEEIMTLMQVRFKQMQLETEDMQAAALVSKKGTVTVKTKQKQPEQKRKSEPESEQKPEPEPEQKRARDLSHNRKKKYILKEGIPLPFLIELGVQTKDGRIVKSRYDKFKQINRFLEYIEDILPALPTGRKISILDFGCGKSYLTFAMYYYLHEKKGYDISIVGLDLKKDVIRHCNELAQKYGYHGLTFLQGDIGDYNEKEEIDMVVTLHACDTATDIAIAKAIAWKARVILCVPCCQHELNAQITCDELRPVLRFGLLKERMAALLTDGIRACTMEAYGYDTQVLEFIDMEHTPKNILLRAVRSDGMRKKGVSMEEVWQMMDMLHTRQTLVELLQQNSDSNSF